MIHEESKLQQDCVAWFRGEYPEFAMLLIHPINEGSGHTQMYRRRQGIHKAEGAVAGASDLLFFLPSYYPVAGVNGQTLWTEVHGLAIEFKTPKGKQSEEQKKFQRMMEAAGYGYKVVRRREDFRVLIISYIMMAYEVVKTMINLEHQAIENETAKKEKEHFYKVIGKKMPE